MDTNKGVPSKIDGLNFTYKGQFNERFEFDGKGSLKLGLKGHKSLNYDVNNKIKGKF